MTDKTNDQTNQNTNNNHNEDCVFCKIIVGDIPAFKVYEDDETLAILDIRPINYGHTLVIPKDHTENLYTLPPELACRMMLTAQKLAISVKNGTDADGITISMNSNVPGQLVDIHAHIHIIPRLNEDGLVEWPHKEYKEGDMQVYQDKIKAEL
jgi:histidine triad (HIT) family protein